MSFREGLYRLHESLFTGGAEVDDEPVVGESEHARRVRLEAEQREARRRRMTMWLEFAFELACHDPLRVEDAMRLGIQEALVLRGLQMTAARRSAA